MCIYKSLSLSLYIYIHTYKYPGDALAADGAAADHHGEGARTKT